MLKFTIPSFAFDFTLGSIISISCAVAAFVVAHKSKKKLDNVCDDLDIAKDKISSKDFDLESYVTNKVIEDVVKECAAKAVDRKADAIAKQALKDADTIFTKKIEIEVNQQYSDTKNMVREALTEKIGRIDISGVKREVMEDAKRMALNELKPALDEVKESYVKSFRSQAETLSTLKGFANDIMKGAI